MSTVTSGRVHSASTLASGGVRSLIGCFACTLLIVACVTDQALVSLDFLHWPGVTAALLVVIGLPHGALDIDLMIHAADDPDRFSLSRSLLLHRHHFGRTSALVGSASWCTSVHAAAFCISLWRRLVGP
jgi:hypothetical protein